MLVPLDAAEDLVKGSHRFSKEVRDVPPQHEHGKPVHHPNQFRVVSSDVPEEMGIGPSSGVVCLSVLAHFFAEVEAFEGKNQP